MTNATAQKPVQIVRTVSDLRRIVSAWRQAGKTVGLVPTMGALHEGHLSLVRHAQAETDHVVVSIFVNPKQFGIGEDFEQYPRTEQSDAEKLSTVGADVLFAPSVAEMYPAGFATTVSVSGISDELCGAARPGHFDGVATVVTKLLLQCLPDIAIFGEKDFQQLATIRRFSRDLDIPVAIKMGTTVREADGLALSSRNAYLSPDDRKKAASIPRVLKSIIAAAQRADAPFAPLLESGKQDLLAAGFQSIDYLDIRDAETLTRVSDLSRPARIFVAARIGKTRLIDNMPLQ